MKEFFNHFCRASKLFLLLLLAVLMTQSSMANVALADEGLSESELTALRDYPNWVASIGGCVDGAGNVVLRGNNNLAKIFNYFVDKGLSKEQAAGIVGNIARESGGDPENIQNPGGRTKDPSNITAGWGLIQWTPGSRALEYQKKFNVDGKIYELGTQLEMIWNHMQKDSPTSTINMLEGFKKITTSGDEGAKQAAIYFEQTMEGAGDKAYPDRVAAAQAALRSYGGATPTKAGDASTDVGCDAGAVSGDAVKTALAYSWPDYHPAPYTKFKPAYKTAIDRAIANGEYVGGNSRPGIDCGGFVTRVMRDSGADPNYNWGPHDSRQGPTPSQQAYMDAHPEKYKRLGPVSSTKDLQPGDIAINSEHTYMFVGKQPLFNGDSASASISFTETGWRTPMASNTYFSNGAGPFIWYRLIK